MSQGTARTRGKSAGGATEKLANEIAALIRSRTFGPGERLREQALADRFGVSRGPIREALNRLAATGLLRLEAGRGAVVPRLDDTEVIANSQASGVLMGLMARRAAQMADSHKKIRLENAMTTMEEAVANGGVRSVDFIRHAEKLIQIMLAAGSSETMARLVEDVLCRGPAIIWQPFAVRTSAQQRARVRQWRKVVDAIVSGNAKAAERAAVAIQEKELDIAIEYLDIVGGATS